MAVLYTVQTTSGDMSMYLPAEYGWCLHMKNLNRALVVSAEKMSTAELRQVVYLFNLKKFPKELRDYVKSELAKSIKGQV